MLDYIPVKREDITNLLNREQVYLGLKPGLEAALFSEQFEFVFAQRFQPNGNVKAPLHAFYGIKRDEDGKYHLYGLCQHCYDELAAGKFEKMHPMGSIADIVGANAKVKGYKHGRPLSGIFIPFATSIKIATGGKIDITPVEKKEGKDMPATYHGWSLRQKVTAVAAGLAILVSGAAVTYQLWPEKKHKVEYGAAQTKKEMHINQAYNILVGNAPCTESEKKEAMERANAEIELTKADFPSLLKKEELKRLEEQLKAAGIKIEAQ